MPPVAPLAAAFKRRLANLPGPVRASGEASNGEPVQVEMLVAGAWVDITAGGYVMVRDDSGQIRITSGIQGSEGSQTERAQAALQLKNTDGRFSPRNPTGPYYGLIGRNTPIRISVPDGNGGKSYRMWGEVSDWAQGWESSGNDVWTDAAVSGILQRLAQGPAPERSVIYQGITDPQISSLVAYWPCEDADGATSITSALVNGSPMTFTGTPTLASYSGFGASDPLPVISSAVLSGGVAKYDDPSSTQVRFLIFIPQAGLADGRVLCAIDQSDLTVGFWELYFTTTGNTLVLRQHDPTGAMLGAELTHTLDVRGRHMRISVELQENGTSCDRALRITDLASMDTHSVTDTAASTSLARVTRVQMGPASRSTVNPNTSTGLSGCAVGHITVQATITAATDLGTRLNPSGETAGRRIQRLCGEEGIAFDWVGDLDDTVEMGGQGRSNLLTLAQECTLADGGLLYENRAVLGLGYRTRASLYNQDAAITLDYAGYNLAEPVPVPVEDDRYVQNKVTVTVNGVSQTYEETEGALSTDPPPAGVGVYGSDVSLNLSSTATATLKDQAAWRVHLGTVDEARYPKISVNLAHSSITPAMKRAILALRLGDRAQITNPPSWLPPDTIDQLILGIDETITRFEHRLTFTCAPASPYTVGVLDATDTRIDTDGSETVAALTTTATSVSVAPTSPNEGLWTKTTSDFPLDIRIGGETIRVTSIEDLVTDTFTRTVSNDWGTNDTGFTWSTGGGTAADYSVNGSAGGHVLATVNSSRRCFLTNSLITDLDYYASITADQLATGGFLAGGLTARYIDSDNLYTAQIRFETTNEVAVMIRKRVGGTETLLGSYTLPGVTFVAGTYYRIRFKLSGSRLRAKAWLASDAETPEWQVTVDDNAIVTTQFVGVRSISSSSNTNVNPSILYDNLAIVSPQRFYITRSINGVVKAHSAAADVRLATPTPLAL